MKLSYILDVGGLSFDEENGVKSTATWVHALPIGNYKHPVYGTIAIDAGRAKSFADGVNNKVRGIDLSINYVHDNNNIAAGWVKKAEDRVDGVWLFVEFTNDAAKEVQDKKWRYFSSEFEDEWEDATGAKHKDVMFGGALTNRPFMKNLVPINLSEDTYTLAFEMVSAITGTEVDALKGGTTVLTEDDLKKIVDGVAAKFAEGKVTPDPAVQKLSEIPELKELAEANPMVKILLQHVESQNLQLQTSGASLREAEVKAKLAEFDRSKIILTPVARQLAETLMMNMPTELQEQFWTLLTEMKKGSSFLVELGERAGATVNYGSAKSAFTQLTEAAANIRKNTTDLSETDAFERACAANPALYTRYRTELVSGVTN